MDVAERLLRRRGGDAIPLRPRVFDTLLFLVEHSGTVLDKERLMEAVWPDSIVEENNLSVDNGYRLVEDFKQMRYGFISFLHSLDMCDCA